MQSILLRRALTRSVPRYPAVRCLATSQANPPKQPPPSSPKSKATADTSKDAPKDEAASSDASPASLSLDFSPAAEKDDKKTTGAKSSKDSLSSIERRRRGMIRTTLLLLGLGTIAGTAYMGREWDEFELKMLRISPENAPNTRWGRTTTRFKDLFDVFNKPQWEELLPPPAAAPFQKPYTLVLSIDDLLVTSLWDRQHGWRTAKRPGVDYFIAYLSQFFEIVIFTSQYAYTAIPILEKMDPYGFFITYRLFREATRSVDGSIRKDLSYLNRDLSKVIVVDTDPEHVALQPENSIVLPKWKGDPNDKGLVAMIPFLESIGIYKPEDVRVILEKYRGKDIPIEYAKTEAEGKRQFLEEWRRTGQTMTGSSFTLSSLFGGSGQHSGPEPETYLEQKRKEAQRMYLEEQAYIKQNQGNLDRLIEEDRQAQAAQMSGNVLGVLGNIVGGMQNPGQTPPPSGSEEGEQKPTKAPS